MILLMMQFDENSEKASQCKKKKREEKGNKIKCHLLDL